MFAPVLGPRRNSTHVLSVAAATVIFCFLAQNGFAGERDADAVIGSFESVNAAREAAGRPATFDFEDDHSAPVETAAVRDGERASTSQVRVIEKPAPPQDNDFAVSRSPDEEPAPSVRPKANAEPPAVTVPPSAVIDVGVAVGSVIEHDFIMRAGDRVFFEPGSSVLDERARVVLAAQARWIALRDQFIAVIEGHASEQAQKEEHIIELSRRRAAAVRNYLIDQGIVASRLFVRPVGRQRPIATCQSPVCAAQNRRVVTVLKMRSQNLAGEPVGQSAAANTNTAR